MSKRRDRKKSDWSESEDSEEEKRSYEPSKHASDPLIKSKGFKKKGEDSTKFRPTPGRGMEVEEISYDKLMELGHTDEITDPVAGLK